MTRAQQTISIGLLVTAVYLCLLMQVVPIPIPKIIQTEILPVLPLWALVSFGSYLLGKLGWNLLTFHDVPQAHAKLTKEIEIARKELKGLGVEVD